MLRIIILLSLCIGHFSLYSQNPLARQGPPELAEMTACTSLVKALQTPDKIYKLDLSGRGYTSFPKDVLRLKNLRWMDLGWDDANQNRWMDSGELKNHIKVLPPEIKYLQKLEYLNLASNCLTTIPPEIGQLKSLKWLSFRWNDILALPKEIGQLQNLSVLNIAQNRLSQVPQEIGQLAQLSSLSLGHNQLKTFPKAILTCPKLRILHLHQNQLSNLPPEIGNLSKLRRLYLFQCSLKEIPESIGQLVRLRELSLHSNQLKKLPASIGQLRKLRRLIVFQNHLTTLPQTIGDASALRMLALKDNQLTTLPASIGKLPHLRLFSLESNRLKSLPPEIKQLDNLDYLSLRKNEDLQIDSSFYHWLSQNYNGMSPRVAEEIHQATLRNVRQQAQLKKEKQRQYYALLLVLGVLLVTCVLVFIIARSARKQRLAKLKIADQAAMLQASNEEIQHQATHLQQSYEQLKELQHFKQKMQAMITHDLKNPLNVIIGLSEMPLNPQNQTIIHQAGLRMNHLIANILDVQKFQKTGMQVQPLPHALRALATSAQEQVDWFARSKNLHLRQSLPDVVVQGDDQLLVRVLVNLLHNAIKYTPQNQEIFLAAEVLSTQKIKITIRDTGEGISPAEQAYIFDEYHQIKAQNLGKVMSTGLGLTFCKMAVEAHKGKIGVTSTPGEGAIFWFTLPLATAIAPPLPTSPSQVTKTPNPAAVTRFTTLAQLTLSEKQVIAPQVALLQHQVVYQLSGIRKILAQVNHPTQDIAAWKNAVEQAALACNEEMYQQLINP